MGGSSGDDYGSRGRIEPPVDPRAPAPVPEGQTPFDPRASWTNVLSSGMQPDAGLPADMDAQIARVIDSASYQRPGVGNSGAGTTSVEGQGMSEIDTLKRQVAMLLANQGRGRDVIRERMFGRGSGSSPGYGSSGPSSGGGRLA